jgi:hypothetical protein
MARVNADLSNYDTQKNFEPLPPGWYEAVVLDSEIKQGPKGSYINWTFGIVGHPNRIWDVMSLGNEVSMQRLKTMAKCCGHKNPNYLADTEELHGMKCAVKLKIEIDESGQYGPKNKIGGFKSLNENIVAASPELPPAAVAARAQQAKGQTENPKMPWE